MFTPHHVSHVTCHMSGVTLHVSLQRGGASWWRVCYQRGLPRLVYFPLLFHSYMFKSIVNSTNNPGRQKLYWAVNVKADYLMTSSYLLPGTWELCTWKYCMLWRKIIYIYERNQSRRGKATKSWFLPTMYHDILTISNLLTWLGMTIYVKKTEATDNIQLIEHIW